MKRLHLTNIILLVLLLMSCNENKVTPTGAYHLSFEFSKELKKDSASLYIIESEYKRLYCQGLSLAKDNSFSWNGHIDGAHAAFISFKNDSIPFFFILEPGNISIKFTTKGWHIEGSKQNNVYMHVLNNRQNILDAKKNLWQKYKAQCNDSTLTHEQERNYMERDSVLNDSLQNYLIWRINVGDPVSIIIKERLFKTLTSEAQKKI